MPAIAESLGTGVFYNCKKLTSISIPEGITILPGGTFYGCSTLESVTLPSTLEKIDGDWIFANCHALKAIAFPKPFNRFHRGHFTTAALCRQSNVNRSLHRLQLPVTATPLLPELSNLKTVHSKFLLRRSRFIKNLAFMGS